VEQHQQSNAGYNFFKCTLAMLIRTRAHRQSERRRLRIFNTRALPWLMRTLAGAARSTH
jgi:hypothetical protein